MSLISLRHLFLRYGVDFNPIFKCTDFVLGLLLLLLLDEMSGWDFNREHQVFKSSECEACV